MPPRFIAITCKVQHMVKIGNDWDELLAGEFKKEYYLNLREFLKREYSREIVYPDMHDIYNALKYTAYKDTKAVILGQDPYHGPNQAHGLCFSVKKGCIQPPSLVNIFKEIKSEYGHQVPQHGELTGWACQGVLLLNACLTVRAGRANSHAGQGWEQLTDQIIMLLNNSRRPIVFLLWGANARAKARYITNPAHLVLSCAHPSPLSAYNGFFGCGHFMKANDFLTANNMEPIDWRIY